jgi:hypothetical protein
MSDQPFIFTDFDRTNRQVSYTISNWEKHKKTHPEMEGQIEDIKQTILDPDIELEADNGVTYYYKRKKEEGIFKNLWLLAIVGYSKGKGIVRTAFFTSKITKDGQVIWMRPGLLMQNKLIKGIQT